MQNELSNHKKNFGYCGSGYICWQCLAQGRDVCELWENKPLQSGVQEQQ